MHFSYYLLGFCSLALTAPAFAQDVTDEDSRDDIVVTAVGVEQPKSDANVAIGIVDEDDIQRRGSITALDQIARLPGISISRNGPIGGFAAVRIRGAEAEQTRVLIDGIAVNDPSSPGGSFDFGTLLTNNIQKIEVLRGANSTTWGNQAIGGVVSIETLSPDEHGLNAQASADYGSYDSKRFSAGIADTRGMAAFSLGGGYYDSDGISAAASGTEPDGMRQSMSHGRLDLNVADPLTLELRGFYSHSRVDLDGSNFVTYLPEDQPLYSTAQQANGYGGLRLALADNRFVSRLGFSVADINRDNYDSPENATANFMARGQTRTLAYKGDWTIASGHRLLFGVERESNRLRTADAWTAQKLSNHNDSAYAQWLFQPNDRLNFVAGARYDRHSIYGGHTSLAANVSYRLAAPLRVRASYSEGYKAPTLFQLDGSAGGYGNAQLKPETARSMDAGVDVRLLDGAFTMSASVFTRKTKDQIAFGVCPTTGEPLVCAQGLRPWGTYFNLTKTKASGVELEFIAYPAPNFSLSANYTLLNATDRSDGSWAQGKRLARRPQDNLHSAARYEHPSGWTFGADMSLVSDSFDDAGNANQLDGYALFGAHASMPLGAFLTVFGHVENLTDAKYQTALGYNSLRRTASVGLRARY